MTALEAHHRPATLFGGWRAHVCVAAIALIAQTIGVRTIHLGNLTMPIQPMVWALLLGLALALAVSRNVFVFALDRQAKTSAPAFVQLVLLCFLTKLGLLIGPQLPALQSMGWALLFQEFGHFFGTIIFALPLALVLGLKREAIGATFSVGREPNIAIIADKYGLDSAEGRGIIGEYLTGSTIGAPFMALFVGLVMATGIFDPIALAMGAGVGSASMLAAITASINANVSPEVTEQVMAVAAAANLITTVLGTYFTLFISLPVAIWLYDRLEPVIGRTLPNAPTGDAARFSFNHNPHIPFGAKVLSLVAAGIITVGIGNWIGFGIDPVSALPGFVIVTAITLLAERIVTLTGLRLPAVCIASFIGMMATAPFHPFAAQVTALTSAVHPLAFATPALAYVGLAVADELGALRYLSWRIVVVSLTAAIGSFIGAAIIATFFGH